MLIPEPPFVFDRDGEWPEDTTVFSRTQAGTFRATLEEFRQSYVDQLHYTNRLLAEVAERILKNSPTPPVILIASSRGPGINLEPGQTSPVRLRERFGTLMLAHLPGASVGQPFLPPDRASLANLFRATLNHVFGAELPLLPPATYVCSSGWPVEFFPAPVEPLLEE